MAIDRRDFLKFVLGGAVGTVFSPLPWVSMDEVAKWSQRWAPIPEKGGRPILPPPVSFVPAVVEYAFEKSRRKGPSKSMGIRIIRSTEAACVP